MYLVGKSALDISSISRRGKAPSLDILDIATTAKVDDQYSI